MHYRHIIFLTWLQRLTDLLVRTALPEENDSYLFSLTKKENQTFFFFFFWLELKIHGKLVNMRASN